MSRQVAIGGRIYEEHNLLCPDCTTPMLLVPHGNKVIYRCARHPLTGCSGSHGAHPGGAPMGIPAPWPVRQARRRAHEVFDQVWRSGKLTRRAAYRWLRGAMGLTKTAAHISRFDAEQCEQVMRYVEQDFGITAAPDPDQDIEGFVEMSFG